MNFRVIHSALCCLGYAASFVTSTAPHSAVAAPVESILYDFGVLPKGATPQTAPTAGPNGVYYGTTDAGGATGNGTVYELIPDATSATGWKQKILFSFSGANGSAPSSALLVGKDGALFGLTANGGAAGNGVAFKLTPPQSGEAAWTETTLLSFNGTSDGAAPFGTLAAGPNGVLYGSTASGGTGQGGVVFSLTPPSVGGSAWTENVVYSFAFGTDGISPTGGVFYDEASGTLYGMTSAGGLNNAGQVYALAPPAAGGSSWTKTDIYDFRSISDGSYPIGGLVRDQNNVLYGVTFSGGLSGWGTIFSLAPPKGSRKAWLETVLYHFTGRLDGGSPDSTPALAADGTLYGTTQAGGSLGEGTVFALTPTTKGTIWTEKALTSFNGVNGVNPGALTLEPSGALIGTTVYGGALGNGGTVFTLTPTILSASDTVWTQTEVVNFEMPSTDAVYPDGALLMGKKGVMYGSANSGGANNDGAVYAVSPPAAAETTWQRTLLYSFNGQKGSSPTGNLLAGANGVLYGVTTSGGPNSATPYGVVYALIPPAAGKTAWTEQVLHAFTGVANGDGAFPAAGLIADASGALYGTAGSGGTATSDDQFGNGIVFKLTPPAAGQKAWKETILYSFSGPDGSTPQGTLLFDGNNALYGTTYTGGAMGEGAVFKLTPPASGSRIWTESLLHSFNVAVGNDGAIPGTEQLVMDAAGNLYGTASQGGANFDGAVFELSPPTGSGTSWTETLLHSFNGADGIGPYVGLLANSAGALFGVTPQGGAYQYYGTIFKLSPPGSAGARTFQVLHNFNTAYGQDGGNPAGALIKDGKGNLYGTAANGGYGNSGVLFEIKP